MGIERQRCRKSLFRLLWHGAIAGHHQRFTISGIQGRIVVPVGERPTDWERNVAGLQDAQWATADMAYRREALAQVGGFDERFPRAYREDAAAPSGGTRPTGSRSERVSLDWNCSGSTPISAPLR